MTTMNENPTLGLFEATSEGLSAKRNYASPAVKVVAFQVEQGFAGSPNQSFTVSNIETFGSIDNDNPDRGWTANDYFQTGEQRVFGN